MPAQNAPIAARYAICSTLAPNSSIRPRKMNGVMTACAWLTACATDRRPSERIGRTSISGMPVSCRSLAYLVGPTRDGMLRSVVLLGDLVQLGLAVLVRGVRGGRAAVSRRHRVLRQDVQDHQRDRAEDDAEHAPRACSSAELRCCLVGHVGAHHPDDGGEDETS